MVRTRGESSAAVVRVHTVVARVIIHTPCGRCREPTFNSHETCAWCLISVETCRAVSVSNLPIYVGHYNTGKDDVPIRGLCNTVEEGEGTLETSIHLIVNVIWTCGVPKIFQ